MNMSGHESFNKNNYMMGFWYVCSFSFAHQYNCHQLTYANKMMVHTRKKVFHSDKDPNYNAMSIYFLTVTVTYSMSGLLNARF